MTTSAPTTRRTPMLVTAAACLLALIVLAHSAGVILFSVVWVDVVLAPGLVFAAMAIAAGATALAAIPGLLRGDRTGWTVTLCWTVAVGYWSVYKVFGEREYESAGFLVAELLLLALLTAPATRNHITARSPS